MTIAPESPAYRRPNPGTRPLTMMNPRPICFLLLSVFVPFLGAGLVHAPSMAATQQPETFKSQFELARKVGNKAGMQQLVKRDMDGAVAFILEVAEGIANNPSELVFERMEALRETWKAEVRTDFCEKMETFFSRIPVPLKRDRRRLRLSYDKLAGDWQTNSKGARDRKEFNRIAAEFTSLADAFKTIGDVYYESNSWQYVALSHDDSYEKKNPNYKEAAKAYARCVETREEIGLKDVIFKGFAVRLKALEKLGYGKPPEAGSAEAEAAAEFAQPVVISSSFELLEDIEAIQRPNYRLDAHYAMWPTLALKGVDSTATFVRMEGGPTAIRTKASEVMLDTNGDGEGDVTVPLRGKTQAIQLEIGDGEAKRGWGFLAVVGHEKLQYQGLEMNAALQDKYAGIYLAPAGSARYVLDGTTLRIIDENLNGVYGDVPLNWGSTGLSADHFEPEVDSIVIGDATRAVPYSEYIQIGKDWYQLEPLNGGAQLQATRVKFPTGELKLDWGKGPKPDFLVVKGRDRFVNCYFDLTSANKVEVPVGRYTISYGRLSKGKRLQSMKALILGDESTTAFDVPAGETVEVAAGGPFDLDFKLDSGDDKFTVPGASVVLVGQAGERYERLWNCVLDPAVSWRKTGAKRGTKGEGMGVHMDREAMAKFGYGAVWFPKDLEVGLRKGTEDFEVQLVVKKNKLFGKITSSWRD